MKYCRLRSGFCEKKELNILYCVEQDIGDSVDIFPVEWDSRAIAPIERVMKYMVEEVTSKRGKS